MFIALLVTSLARHALHRAINNAPSKTSRFQCIFKTVKGNGVKPCLVVAIAFSEIIVERTEPSFSSSAKQFEITFFLLISLSLPFLRIMFGLKCLPESLFSLAGTYLCLLLHRYHN